jgi:Tubulin folding cofactor D C terminal
LFEKHQHDGRVTLPLLKTIDLLLNRLCLDSLIGTVSFTIALLRNLREEAKGCTDTQRLLAILNVSCDLIGPETRNGGGFVLFVCDFLRHPFPRVRCIAAEKLYIRLLESNVAIDETHPVVGLLLHHSWESDDGDLEFHMKMVTAVSEVVGVGD